MIPWRPGPVVNGGGAMTILWWKLTGDWGHGNVCWEVILGKFQGGAFTPKTYTDAEAKKMDSHFDPTWKLGNQEKRWNMMDLQKLDGAFKFSFFKYRTARLCSFCSRNNRRSNLLRTTTSRGSAIFLNVDLMGTRGFEFLPWLHFVTPEIESWTANSLLFWDIKQQPLDFRGQDRGDNAGG